MGVDGADPDPHRRGPRAAPAAGARRHAEPGRRPRAQRGHPPLARCSACTTPSRAPAAPACWSGRSLRASPPAPHTGCRPSAGASLDGRAARRRAHRPLRPRPRVAHRHGRIGAHGLPAHRRPGSPADDHGQRPPRRGRAPQLARPRRRGLLRAARLRRRRRPAAGALAVDRPPRRAHGAPGRAARGRAGPPCSSTSARPRTPPSRSSSSISAGASVIAAGSRRQDLVRLVTTDGADSGFAAGHAHVEAIMEHLASVEATNDAGFQRVLDRLVASAGGGALVVMVALPSAADLDRVARMRRRFGSLTIVQFDPSSWDPSAPDAGGRPSGQRRAAHHARRVVRRHLEPAGRARPPADALVERADHGRGPGHRGSGRRRLGPLGPPRTGRHDHDRHPLGSHRRIPPPATQGPAPPRARRRDLPRPGHAGRRGQLHPGVHRRRLRHTADRGHPGHPPRRCWRHAARASASRSPRPSRSPASSCSSAGSSSRTPPGSCCRPPTPSTRPATRSTPRGRRSRRSWRPPRPSRASCSAAAAGLFFAIFLADWAAFRLWAAVEAIVPSLTHLRVHRTRRVRPVPGRHHHHLRRARAAVRARAPGRPARAVDDLAREPGRARIVLVAAGRRVPDRRGRRHRRHRRAAPARGRATPG